MVSFVVNLPVNQSEPLDLLVKGVLESCKTTYFENKSHREIHVLCGGNTHAFLSFQDEFFSQGGELGFTSENTKLISDIKEENPISPVIIKTAILLLASVFLWELH